MKNKSYLLAIVIAVLSLSTLSCSEYFNNNSRWEQVLERYPNGAKKIVGIYKGTGSNETFLERRFYQENGKLGRIEHILEDSVSTYLDLYPVMFTANGLRNFLQGDWLHIHKIEHPKYDIFETYALNIDENELTRFIRFFICEGEKDIESPGGFGATLNSTLIFEDDLKLLENDFRFSSSLYLSSFYYLITKYGIDANNLKTSLFLELNDQGIHTDADLPLIDLIHFTRILILDNSIGESFITSGKALGYDRMIGYYNQYNFKDVGRVEFTRGRRPANCRGAQRYFQ